MKLNEEEKEKKKVKHKKVSADIKISVSRVQLLMYKRKVNKWYTNYKVGIHH